MKQKISEKIVILGFIMTCFMVFFHCGGRGNADAINSVDASCNTFLTYVFTTMGMLVMSHFFTVTGFLLFHNYSLKDYSYKIKRRVCSLLIPYVVWQIIIALKLVVQGEYIFTLKDFLIQTFGLTAWPVNGPMWYVFAIFLLALVSPVFLLIFKNKKVGWCIILAIIIFLEARDYITNPLFVRIINHGYVWNILFYLPSYLVGAFYGKFSDELKEANSLVYIFSLLFIAFLLDGTFSGFLSYTTIKMMPFAGLVLLPVISSLKNKWIYKLTFLMYAMHQPLTHDIWPYIERLYQMIPMPVSVYNVLARIIALLVDIGLAAIIYVVLNKFAPKVLKILTGDRTA